VGLRCGEESPEQRRWAAALLAGGVSSGHPGAAMEVSEAVVQCLHAGADSAVRAGASRNAAAGSLAGIVTPERAGGPAASFARSVAAGMLFDAGDDDGADVLFESAQALQGEWAPPPDELGRGRSTVRRWEWLAMTWPEGETLRRGLPWPRVLPAWAASLPRSEMLRGAPGGGGLEPDEDASVGLTVWGNALLRAGRPRFAEARFRAALSLDPSNTAALLNVGAAWLRDGEPEASAVAAALLLGRGLAAALPAAGDEERALGALREWTSFGAAALAEAHAAMGEGAAQAAPGGTESLVPLRALGWALDGPGGPASVQAPATGGVKPSHVADALRNAGIGSVGAPGALLGAVSLLERACGARCGGASERLLRAGGGSEGGAAVALLVAGHLFPSVTTSPASPGAVWSARARCAAAAIAADSAVAAGCGRPTWGDYWEGLPEGARREWPAMLPQLARARRMTGLWGGWDREHALLAAWLRGSGGHGSAEPPATLEARRALPQFDSLLLPLGGRERLDAALAKDQAPPPPDPPTRADPVAPDASLLHPLLLTPWAHRASLSHLPPLVPPAQEATLAPRPAAPGALLRVLYVSHDFAGHPTGTMVAALPRHHSGNRAVLGPPGGGAGAPPPLRSRGAVLASAIHYGKVDCSAAQRAMASAFLPFLTAHATSNEAVIRAARSLGPHIALDLQGPTLGERPELLRRRLAPVQATFLILPGTTGRRHMDAFVADGRVVPPELAGRRFSEALVLLPRTYQANDWPGATRRAVDAALRRTVCGDAAVVAADACDGAAVPSERQRELARREAWGAAPDEADAVAAAKGCVDAHRLAPAGGRAALGLAPGGRSRFVFASLNKLEKLWPETVAAWSQVLRRARGAALLWLLAPGGQAPGKGGAACGRGSPATSGGALARLCEELAARGVPGSWVRLAERGSQLAHMLRLGHADVFLDGVGGAYGAHSTASDALRAGLPVLTVGAPMGQMPAAVAASVLRGVLGPAASRALVQPSVRGYVATASRLAGRPAVAAALRRRVAAAVLGSTEGRGLFSQEAFAEDLDRALRAMWEAHTLRRGGDGRLAHVVTGSPRERGGAEP